MLAALEGAKKYQYERGSRRHCSANMSTTELQHLGQKYSLDRHQQSWRRCPREHLGPFQVPLDANVAKRGISPSMMQPA